MKIKTVNKKILCFLIVTASIFLFFFVTTSAWIGHEVKKLCQEAKWEYQRADCVEALILQLEDEKQDYKTRNHAVWALGQFGDSRALPVLEKYYTGNIPDKESVDKTISQYELKKAINLASGGANIASWTWR